MNKEIKEWLQSSRDYYQGSVLYNRYGHNRVLRQRFSVKNSTTEALLLTELCKLTNITEDQARKLPRKAKINTVPVEPKTIYPDNIIFEFLSKLGLTSDDLERETFPEFLVEQEDKIKTAYDSAKITYQGFPETTRKIIKLREQYPFLNEDSCPDELKLLVHDMFTEHDKYRNAHLKLSEAPENAQIEQLFTDAQTTVESYLSNRQIWAELDHYKENGTILGEHPKLAEYSYTQEISEMDDAKLMQVRLNARSNISRTKKTYDKSPTDDTLDAFTKWNDKLAIIEKEIENRKK